MKFNIQHFAEIASTNSYVMEQARLGANEGLVIVADYQTEGRGKPGRKWISSRGKNLLFSVLLRPPLAAHEAPLLTQTVCRSVAAVLKNHGISPAFKRPNDLMVDGKKICGVLVEASSSASGVLESVVAGIGLNVNSEKDELIPEAISMKEASGQEFSREELLEEILNQLKTDLSQTYAHSV